MWISTSAGRAAWSLLGGFTARLDAARSAVILISTHAEQDYAELIAASPAVGFLSKTAISADAIQDLLASHNDSKRDDPVSGPREK